MTPKQEQEDISMMPRKRIRLSICPSPSSTSAATTNTTTDDCGGSGSGSDSDSDNTADRRNVRVVARVRPISAIEKDTKVVITATTTTSPSIVVGDPTAASASAAGGDTATKCYQYDAVFGPESTQESVYKESGAMYAVRNDILQGFNCTILAYGQTGGGKTFTMGTTTTTTTGSNSSGNSSGNTIHEMDGIIPRAVYDLFDQSTKLVESDGTKSVDVDMSFLEIYNEEARDLLLSSSSSSSSSDGGGGSGCPPPSNLYIREGPNGEVYVQNLTWEKVTSHSHVGTFMDNASRRRVVASTQMNAVSSRSHAICTLRVTVTDASRNNQKSVSKLTLVDLAGSERVKRTKAEGNRLKEGININKGLFTLGQVVSCLSEIGQSATTTGSTAHVPYRDSKLTRLLQDSLGGNSRTIMVACVSPADSNVEESTNTLRYASRARNIKNTATRNLIETQNMPPEVAAALRNENFALRQKVIQLEAQLRESTSTGTTGTRSTATTVTSSLSSSLVSPLSATNEEIGTFSSSNLVTNLRGQIVALQTRVDNLQDQASRLVQDSLQASLSADKFRLQLEEVLDIAKRNGLIIQFPTISKLDKDSSSSTSSTIALVEELRTEIEACKTREQEARVEAEVARATAATVIVENGNLTAVHDAILTSNRDVENQEDIDNETDESLLTAELLSVNGNIEKKEEIVRQAIIEKQCLEAMKSKFEGALQSLQVEVETLSAEKKDLESIVESIPENKPGNTQMRRRIKELEKRISDLQSKANEHKKSLRLRELAERRCAKLEAEIKQDKKRKADLQRRLKDESSERRKDKKTAKLQAAKLMKDSQRLKYELQKVKMAAERQSMVLRRKTAELNNKMKKQADQQRKRKRVQESKQQQMDLDSIPTEKRESILSWLDSKIQASMDMASTNNQIAHQELLLEETLLQMRSKLDASAVKLLEEEAETRGRIIDQLKMNLKTMKNSSSKSTLKETWNELSQSETAVVICTAVEKLSMLQLELNRIKDKEQEKVDKAVAATKAEEVKKWEEAILRLRIEHADVMSCLLDSTRMAFANEVQEKQQGASAGQAHGGSMELEERLQLYFDGCDAATKSIKEEIEKVKEQREGMQNAVEKLANDIILNNETAKKKKSSKPKPKRKPSFEDFSPMEESFIFDEELDDGNDSDWSPDDDERNDSNKKKASANHDDDDDKEDTVADVLDLDSLKVSELKDKLREYGLKISGKKADLKARLKDYMVAETSNDLLQSKIQEKGKKQPLRPLDVNSEIRILQDTESLSAKRITSNTVRQRRKRNMNAAVSNAMMELAKL